MTSKIKAELAKCARELACEGVVSGTSGNISTKQGSLIYIKKSNTGFKNAKSGDFVDIKDKKQASIEWKLHNACYRIRPDVKAVVHTHPTALLALASAGIKIKPVTIDFAIYFKKGIKYTKYAPPGSKKLASAVAKAIKYCNGVIMAGHGLVTAGKSLKEAAFLTIIAEREARIILAAKLLRKSVKPLTPYQLKSIYKL